MGLLFVILAAVLFGAAPTVQRLVLAGGVSPESLMASTNAVLVAGALSVCALRRCSLRVARRQLVQLVLMGLAMVSTGLLLIHAYLYLPVGFVTMIHFLYPTVVTLVMALFFGEKLTPLRGAAIAVSVGGLILLGGGAGGSLTGVVLAALSSLTYASYVILNDRGGANSLPLPVRLAYAGAVSMAVCLAASLAGGGAWPAGGRAWGLTLLAGALLGGAYFFLVAGIGLLGASTAAFVNMLEPVTSLLLSAAVWHYAVSGRSLLGCALVLCSVLLIALGGRAGARSR